MWGADAGAAASRADGGRWLVRHAPGVTRYQHAVAGLEQELAVVVAPDDAVKVAMLTLTDTSTADASSERLRLRGVVPRPAASRRAAVRRHRARRDDGAVLARKPTTRSSTDAWRSGLASERAQSFTCDRAEFVGRNRTLSRPAALLRARLTRAQWRRAQSVRSAPARLRRSRRVAQRSPSCWVRDATARRRSSLRPAAVPPLRPRRRSTRATREVGGHESTPFRSARRMIPSI